MRTGRDRANCFDQMKTYGQLWERIVSEENLREAWRKVRKGRSKSRRICAYGKDLDANLAALRRSLVDGSYRPGEFRQFVVRDPKPRTISCAPVADRVVHHALCNVLAPVWERRFIRRTYACRKGLGTHVSCLDARRESARHAYFVKLDVRHYFQTIDHDILVRVVTGMVRERPLKELIERIIRHPVPGCEAGRGIPIGNLTSQWFANLYLDGLDHLMTDETGLGNAYFRYMDDILVFCESKTQATAIAGRIGDYVEKERRLSLKESATRIAPVGFGVPYLGLRIWHDRWRIRRGRFLHTRRAAAGKMKQYLRGDIGEQALCDSLKAHQGLLDWFGFRNVLANVDRAMEGVGGDAGWGSVAKRGGSWNNDAANIRCAIRNGNNGVSNTNNNNGFRLASTISGDTEWSHSARPDPGEPGRMLRPFRGTNMRRPARLVGGMSAQGRGPALFEFHKGIET